MTGKIEAREGAAAQPDVPEVRIGNTRANALSRAEGLTLIERWADARESRSVVFANAHVITTAERDPQYQRALAAADLVVPDGVPVVWTMRKLGHPEQDRLYGPDMMLELCQRAAVDGRPIFLYGSSSETLALLERRLAELAPGITIAGSISPPFRPLDEAELTEHLGEIARSGARLVFVGLGAPKQELWMARAAGRLDCVMLGVGAAFDFHAGTVRQAPSWMQRAGLEWLFRLAVEPRRLWKRYLVGNTHFLLLMARGVVRHRRGR